MNRYIRTLYVRFSGEYLLFKGEGGVYKGQKSHNPVGAPSFQQFKAFMEIPGISQISLE